MGTLNGTIPIVDLENPSLEAAKERLAGLLAVFNFNEVLVTLDQLDAEIDSMPLAKRFRTDERIGFMFSGPVPKSLVDQRCAHMTETEYKRFQLKTHLQRIRTTVLNLRLDFEDVFLDTQAAKTD